MHVSSGGRILPVEGIWSSANHVNWGDIEPPMVVNRTIQLKNIGNTPVELNITAGAIYPSKYEPFLEFSWSGNQTIGVGHSVPVILQLNVIGAPPAGDFNFDIHVDKLAGMGSGEATS
jgi:hypothetical protein